MRIWQRLLHILIPAMLSFQAHNQITGSRQGAGDSFLTCALLDVSAVLWEASDTERLPKQKCSRNELSLKIDIYLLIFVILDSINWYMNKEKIR